MVDSKKSSKDKPDFLRVAGYVTTIFVFITAGFSFGQYFKGASLDNEKLRLERHNMDLEDSIERLKATIRTDSSSRKNFILQNTHYLDFNTDSFDLPTLLVANATIAPCVKGAPDGCWKQYVYAKPGDDVGVQIYFHNTGDDSVANVSLGYRVEYTNTNRTVVCRGGIMVGNTIASIGVAHIFAKEPIKLIYHPEATKFFRSGRSKGEFINTDSLFGTPIFRIGTIPIGQDSQGMLVLNFKVEKAN